MTNVIVSSLFLNKIKYLQLAKDLLHPSPEEEKRRHKKKRLVQSPNSYFMDVKCPGRSADVSTRPSPPPVHSSPPA